MELWQTLKNRPNQYPFHMPGHKGGKLGAFPEIMMQDITEIKGFDNLHQPQGILLEAQKRCAALFGAEESFFLVNGSTSGILSAVMAVCKEGDEIAVARNCHKSVYSALVFSGANPDYIMPERIEDATFLGEISLEQIQKTVTKQTKAVILTSPTYEGITSDIAAISNFVHQKGMVLIVDEAHGAHMNFHDFFPKTALQQQADIVIQSLHKTLPCPTQTAVLHVQGNRVDRQKLKQSFAMFQTSSPSYLFLAAMDFCCHWLEKQGKIAFEQYVQNLKWFYAQAKQWKHISLFDYPNKQEKGKLILQLFQRQMTGIQLNDILIEKYHIELEMGFLYHAIAMTSPADTKEGFDALYKAITQIDTQLCDIPKVTKPFSIQNDLPIIQYSPRKAFFAAKKEIPFQQSQGNICGEFMIPYPPGIPIVAPGEVLTKEKIQQINHLKKANISFVGCHDSTLNNIKVLQ